jgi:gas vesicle protein
MEVVIMRRMFLAVFAALVVLFPRIPLQAQADKHKLVILSPRVGSMIDSSEREYFQLFPKIKDFHNAIFLENPDSTYYAWIVLKDSSGNTRDTAIWYPKGYLLMVAEKISHFEELTEGQYQMGQNPATLQVVESEEATRAPAPTKPRPQASAKVVEPESLPVGSRSEAGKKDQLLARGASVVVFLNDGRQVTGELLAVRDTALLIDTLVGKAEDSIATQIAGIVGVSRDAVQKVRVKGESLRLKGTLIGAAIGAAVGGVIGLASGDDKPNEIHLWPYTAGQKALAYGTVLGVAGAFIGGIIGVESSSKDKRYDATVKEDWASLKAVARYPDKEPEFLKKIK